MDLEIDTNTYMPKMNVPHSWSKMTPDTHEVVVGSWRNVCHGLLASRPSCFWSDKERPKTLKSPGVSLCESRRWPSFCLTSPLSSSSSWPWSQQPPSYARVVNTSFQDVQRTDRHSMKRCPLPNTSRSGPWVRRARDPRDQHFRS